jgi:hypothetical protein
MSKPRHVLAAYLRRIVQKGAIFISLPCLLTNRSCEEPLIIGPPKLPVELLIAVIGFVDGRKELCRLCRVSKLVRDIAGPILYERHFVHCKLAQGDIRVILQHPRLEIILANLSIELCPWIYCSRYDNRRGDFYDGRICSCDKLDSAIGEALNGLLNLEVLRLHCSLCPQTKHERHTYFTTLKTRVLRKVDFSCQFSKMDERKVLGNLMADCMTSVVSLGWFTHGYTSNSKEHFKSALVSGMVLPNLRHVHCRMKDPTSLLLHYRPITRLHTSLGHMGQLSLDDFKDEQDNLIRTDTGIPKNSTIHSFEAAINVPFPFRNLQHIGTFYLLSSNASVSLWNPIFLLY